MTILRLLRTETARMMLMGFAVGAIALATVQPGQAMAEPASDSARP